MTQSLYSIAEEQRALNTLLEENGGELTPALEQALAINAENFLSKSGNYVLSIKDYEAWEDRLTTEIARLQQMKRVATRCKDRLKERLIWAMREFDYSKVELDLHTLSLRRTMVVNITDATAVPKQYYKVELTLDMKRLRDDLKHGDVAGAELTEGYYIHIR